MSEETTNSTIIKNAIYAIEQWEKGTPDLECCLRLRNLESIIWKLNQDELGKVKKDVIGGIDFLECYKTALEEIDSCKNSISEFSITYRILQIFYATLTWEHNDFINKIIEKAEQTKREYFYNGECETQLENQLEYLYLLIQDMTDTQKNKVSTLISELTSEATEPHKDLSYILLQHINKLQLSL